MRSNHLLRCLASRCAWPLLWVTVFGSTLWVVSSERIPARHRCRLAPPPEKREQALPGKSAPGPEGRFVRAARSSPLLLLPEEAARAHGNSPTRKSLR